jgi:hypothetical protein
MAAGTHGDALDVVTQHLPVALGAALAETLAALATTGHLIYGCWWSVNAQQNNLCVIDAVSVGAAQ